MQIVIEIPEEWFNDMVREEFIEVDELCAVIQHSTILPKGHGRLIDESKIKKCGWNFIDHHAKTDAPTIIEADKEQEE